MIVFSYLFKVKYLVLSALFFSTALLAEAQVIFRNDFVIGKHHKVKNKGITFVTINLERYPNLNMLVNGRGGRSLVIDVEALRNPEKTYTYSELAERIYTPGPTYRPVVEPVPTFLLLEPPTITPWIPTRSARIIVPRSRFFLEQ